MCDLHFSGSLDGSCCAARGPSLAEQLSQSTELRLWLGEVTAIDLAGVELLLKLKLSGARRGARVRVVAASAPVRALLARLALAGYLGID
jgi:ABC-type transporter Mla MlaB component